ncbi:MAG: hexosyltransferase [Planctomycetaceae bacterium]|nr:hexosyltransferase [Planctomycetaceae bacterium]
MHIAIITAGGAGMFCGSCMHDNTWARALHDHGCEISLIPTYTPIRVDEDNISNHRVFFGGINVYLEHRYRFWQSLPNWMTGWLDAPWLINMATKFSVSNDAKQLGDLTIDMLEGESGPQRKEVEQLAQYLAQLKPDVVCFSNALLVGVIHRLREAYSGKIVCTLQGDDIFLESLPESYRERCIQLISEKSREFHGFLVHSNYYRDFMSEYLSLPKENFRRIPLGIDLTGHDGEPNDRGNEVYRVGYFARICPEKGLHNLISAFRELHKKHPNCRLLAGGYLGKRDEQYALETFISAADLGDAFQYIGSPESHEEKVKFLKSLDVLSVPTDYLEPKGISILEAIANGVPVVQPRHGAFPELIEATGGGLLYEPNDVESHVRCLEELMEDTERRRKIAAAGHQRVRELYSPEVLARETVIALESL